MRFFFYWMNMNVQNFLDSLLYSALCGEVSCLLRRLLQLAWGHTWWYSRQELRCGHESCCGQGTYLPVMLLIWVICPQHPIWFSNHHQIWLKTVSNESLKKKIWIFGLVWGFRGQWCSRDCSWLSVQGTVYGTWNWSKVSLTSILTPVLSIYPTAPTVCVYIVLSCGYIILEPLPCWTLG